MIASMELQKAIYSALNESEYDVFEVAPPDHPMPYMTIGEYTLIDSDTKTHRRTTHSITVHTWYRGNSSLESKIMNDLVHNTILNINEVNGFYVDKITLELLTTLRETHSDSTVFHGVLEFEITLTEEG